MSTALNPKLDREYVVRILELLLQTPSPSGYCMPIMSLIQEEAAKLSYQVEMTPKRKWNYHHSRHRLKHTGCNWHIRPC